MQKTGQEIQKPARYLIEIINFFCSEFGVVDDLMNENPKPMIFIPCQIFIYAYNAI